MGTSPLHGMSACNTHDMTNVIRLGHYLHWKWNHRHVTEGLHPGIPNLSATSPNGAPTSVLQRRVHWEPHRVGNSTAFPTEEAVGFSWAAGTISTKPLCSPQILTPKRDRVSLEKWKDVEKERGEKWKLQREWWMASLHCWTSYYWAVCHLAPCIFKAYS